MRFIDCNAAIGSLATDRYLPQDPAAFLQQEMSRCGIDKALCWNRAAIESGLEDGNRAIVARARLFPVWVLVPEATGEWGPADQLKERIIQAKTRGIRLFPNKMRFPLASWATGSLFNLAEELNLPVFIDWEEADACSLYEAAAGHPGVNIVIASPHYRNIRYLYALLQAASNLYLETSLIKTFRGMEQLCESVGAHRLLFGSGMPILEYGPAVTGVLAADLSVEEKKLIAHGNLERLLEKAGGLG